MKKITNDFLDSVFELTLIEYTKNRFISEDEYEDFKKEFLNIFSEKIISESFDEQKITLILRNQ